MHESSRPANGQCAIQASFVAQQLTERAHLLLSILAEVLIVALHELALNIKIQALFQGAFAPHIQAHLQSAASQLSVMSTSHKASPSWTLQMHCKLL